MDYRIYGELLAQYHKLDAISFDKSETEAAVIQKLVEISCKKKKIQTQSNAIIREFIETYEKKSELIDSEAAERLRGFMDVLIPNRSTFLDVPIAFRIAKLLFGYYQRIREIEQTILMLEYCTVFDTIIIEHLDDNEGSRYAAMAEQYLPEFDGLSTQAKRSLVNCWLLSVVNRKDMTYAIKRYRTMKEPFEAIRRKMGDSYMAAQYMMCKSNALAFALEACRRAEYAKKTGKTLNEPTLDMKKEAPLIEELTEELYAVLLSEDAGKLLTDRVLVRLYCMQADYHLGKISMEELLVRLEECTSLREDYRAAEQCTALFTAHTYYLDYLHRCSHFDSRYVLRKGMEIIRHVLTEAKKHENLFGRDQTNYCVLMLVNTASNIVDFEFFKSTVLDATVYANKALYVHTMMVKEICFVLLSYILEHNPQYLNGVCGQSWEYHKAHEAETMELMENCALFHDIGKYFCLDYVSNSSRNLTDDEFSVIKAHPANFLKIYQGKMSLKAACVHDCALLHHLWYNESGGYPREKHTGNKPFVNIISIADSLDAATDNIGRPYGHGKTYDDLVSEFDGMKDTRYSGYICELLHLDEIRQKIAVILDRKRKEIYYNSYMSLEE